MNDENERSVASAGSVSVEPAAWAVFTPDEDFWTRSRRDAESWMADGLDVIPLYRHPQPTLTDAEREAVRFCRTLCEMGERADLAATLRGLLERMGGER